MSDYVVSARKYRPDSFESLIGQDNISRTLKNSILRGQLAHAYLFCGPRGVGKTSAARIFARTINCLHPTPDMEPCGECESCLSFKEGRSYCIHELDAASNNGVEDIKALMEQVQIPPQVGRYSVYIIDEVHMLSTSAFNAFLKTLEEPPSHAVFILATTEKHKILPTILSRCQTYDFNRISVPDIVRNLKEIAAKEGIAADDAALHVIAQKADGAMRDALTIFDQTVAFCGTDIKYSDVIRNLDVLDCEYGFRLVDAFLARDYASALLIFDEVLSKGFNALHFINDLALHIRNLLVSRTGGLDSLLDMPESLGLRYREQAGRCSVGFLYSALGTLRDCESSYRGSASQRLLVEYSLMKLSFLSGVPEESPAQSSSDNSAASGQGQAAPVSAASSDSVRERKSHRTGASLSLSALMEEGKNSSDVSQISGPGVSAPVPADDVILAKWKEFASSLASSQPRLSNTLLNARLEIVAEDDGKAITFFVTNESQKVWIEEKMLRGLEDKLCALLGSGRIRLVVCVEPQEEQAPRIYMPGEKAQDLMGRNPEVKELVMDLGLEIR